MRRRYYIVFVSAEENGKLRKIPVPLHYAYVFAAAAVIGLFTITGMAGSYTRMLIKTASFNQIRSQQDALRKNYQQLEAVAKEKEVQAASLGALANEVSALYGLKQSKLSHSAGASSKAPAVVDNVVDNPDNFTDANYTASLDELTSLRTTALSGRLSRAFEIGLSPTSHDGGDSVINMADAPELWPVMGPITSSFGERADPFNGEGAFHKGIDISASYGEPVRATADGVVVTAGMGNGYGREILIDHGSGIATLYGHLSGFACTPGEQVKVGQIIGYVGTSGRSTGPHLHYEVHIRNTAVNPHKYLRETMEQLASTQTPSTSIGN